MNNNDKLYLAHFLFPETSGNEKVEGVLQRAASADRICRLKFSEGEYTQDLCLQVFKDTILLSHLIDTDASDCELKTPEEIKRASFYLLNCFQLTYSTLSDSPALLMSRRKYEELREQSDAYTLYVLTERLTAETGDVVNSPQLASVMKSPTAEGELKLCSLHEGIWSFQRALYMENNSGGWLVRVSGRPAEDWMIAVPLTRPQLCSIFYKWLLQPIEVSNGE
ncbi:hypothetical protein JI735_26425 [Paenibacillus sonchi]|uniref:Uncharacterized protein n=1 Tax=Paenibacillus sonchi TaxID=373687 RepID=A0A974SCB7_9BACL|nr:hypothetical protein [Paenibacillus sonchi]MCE3201358.1 hypothetical protein [Paenibacillus sonchi]QQZ60056.1 hypothetical protein JI735_26425 [Paenibacillus sonchi]